MKKQSRRKNPHAVALGRLGGLVRSVAKQRANKQNGRKGGLVKSLKKTLLGAELAPRLVYGATDDPFLSYGWSPLRSLIEGQWKARQPR